MVFDNVTGTVHGPEPSSGTVRKYKEHQQKANEFEREMRHTQEQSRREKQAGGPGQGVKIAALKDRLDHHRYR